MDIAYNRFFLFLLPGLLISTSSIHSFIYQAETLADSKGTHPTITLLYDVHVDYPDLKVTDLQGEEIIELVTAQKFGLVVEDFCGYQGSTHNIEVEKAIKDLQNRAKDHLEAADPKQLTGHLVFERMLDFLRKSNNISDIMNVDHRILSLASSVGYDIPAREVWNYYDELCCDLLDRQTDRAFPFYESIIASFHNDNNDLIVFMKDNDKKNLAHFGVGKPVDASFRTESYLDCFVDLMMLRAIDQLNHCEHIVMVCGGHHCDNVSSYLKILGYTPVASEATKAVTRSVESEEMISVKMDPIKIVEYFKSLTTKIEKLKKTDQHKVTT